MSDGPTCGQGVAANAALPDGFAAVIDGIAANLELHMTALDVSDPADRKEHTAYERVAGACRTAAAELRTLAREMTASRDVPMGAHDEQAMAAPKFLEAFEDLVLRETELLRLLEERREGHEEILSAWRDA